MQISRSTLQKALFKVYRIAVSPEADIATTHDLQDAWPNTGLRQSDFAAALDELVQRQWLVVTHHGTDTWIELTPAGVRALHDSEDGWRQELLDWVILKRTELRQIKKQATQPRVRQRRTGEPNQALRHS